MLCFFGRPVFDLVLPCVFSPKNQWLTWPLRDNQSFCALALVTYLVLQPRTTAPLRGDPRARAPTTLGVVLRCLCVGFEGFTAVFVDLEAGRLHRALCALWLRRRAAGFASLTAQH